jgi:hypothetical protein
MNLWMKSYYRARNFTRDSRELGLRTAVQVVWNRISAVPVVAVRPSGIAAPVYYRPGTDDLTDLRRTFGNQKPVCPTSHPRLIVDANPGIGFAAIEHATRYPRAEVVVVGTQPEHRDLLRRNCAGYRNITLVEMSGQSADTVSPDPISLASVFLGRRPENREPVLPSGSGLLTDAHRCIDLLKLDLASVQRELFNATASEWLPRVRTLVIDLGSGAHSSRDPVRSAFDAVPHRRYHLVDRLVIDFA